MRPSLGPLAAAAVLLAAAALTVPQPVGATTTPAAPTAQPWGAAPANIGSYANGAVLRSKPVDASLHGVPLPATSWLVQYKSMDQHGRPNAYLATILVPTAAWAGPGPRPLVSYQFAEDGLAYRCSPSYALTAGPNPDSLGSAEPPAVLTQALLKGWAVVVPDYEGPGSDFTGRKGSGHGVLDGIRAARRFRAAGITRNAPVALWGYSGGSLASYWALQEQPTYAPRMRLVGTALGGMPADLVVSAHAFSAIPGVSSALNVAFGGFDRAYPGRHILRYFNAKGRAAVVANRTSCLLDGIATYADTTLAGYGITDAELRAIAHGIGPSSYGNLPRTPTLLYTARLDEIAPVGPIRTLTRRLCAAGAPVSHYEGLGDHATGMVLMASQAVAYLDERFHGTPVERDC